MRMPGVIITLVLLLIGCSPQPQVAEPGRAPGVPESWKQAGFLRADRPRLFRFPEDHGPHDGYRTEWWYLTGNLESSHGRRFGYQFTLFRIALTPELMDRSSSNWRTSHIWMGHLALTDIDEKRHYHRERFSREALGLAGAQSEPLRIWLEDWRLYREDHQSPWRLTANSDLFSLDLSLQPLRAPLLQGDKGLSHKGSQAGNASYYYSITRLATSGRLTLADETLNLRGLSWLDREWSTSALSEELAGWDWFSLQLDDATDLMFYRLRKKSGGSSAQSAGSVLDADGRSLALGSDDVTLSAIRWWTSEKGVRYPVAWELQVKPLQRRLLIEALVENQEMNVSVRYWEGAVKVTESGMLAGYGYLEMTGY